MGMISRLLALLGGDALREAVERFNARDRELVRAAIPNAEAAFMGSDLDTTFDGSHYHHGKGLRLYADGKELATSDTLRRLTVPLSQ